MHEGLSACQPEHVCAAETKRVPEGLSVYQLAAYKHARENRVRAGLHTHRN